MTFAQVMEEYRYQSQKHKDAYNEWSNSSDTKKLQEEWIAAKKLNNATLLSTMEKPTYTGPQIDYSSISLKCIRAAMDEYKFTMGQAEFIYSYCNEHYHAHFSEVIEMMPELCQLFRDFSLINDYVKLKT